MPFDGGRFYEDIFSIIFFFVSCKRFARKLQGYFSVKNRNLHVGNKKSRRIKLCIRNKIKKIAGIALLSVTIIGISGTVQPMRLAALRHPLAIGLIVQKAIVTNLVKPGMLII
ncbi:MAG: hypothetical protein HFH49_09480 [Lachnospiraceae bacterium]|nr:hypothetical protein [Lachnospiraceae bacterium]